LHQVGLRSGQLRLVVVMASEVAVTCVIELSMVTRCWRDVVEGGAQRLGMLTAWVCVDGTLGIGKPGC